MVSSLLTSVGMRPHWIWTFHCLGAEVGVGALTLPDYMVIFLGDVHIYHSLMQFYSFGTQSSAPLEAGQSSEYPVIFLSPISPSNQCSLLSPQISALIYTPI